MNFIESKKYYEGYGAVVPYDSPSYVSRQADKDLFEGLMDGYFCSVLNSRQMGKSSLSVRAIKKLEEQDIVCISIDISSCCSPTYEEEQWYKVITMAIADELKDSGNLLEEFDVDDWWNKNSRPIPKQRLERFITKVVLEHISKKIVIFLDEIDSILRLKKFSPDLFFNLIRNFYNYRSLNEKYQRLNFAIIGVFHPIYLIENEPNRTPFNLGKEINLYGFKLSEIHPLIEGLIGKVTNPQEVLKCILYWTEGQPFLTQKLCHIIYQKPSLITASEESKSVLELVEENIIKNLQIKEDKHFKPIVERIEVNKNKNNILQIYRSILQGETVIFEPDSLEHIDLKLTGLVVEKNGCLKVFNPIYERIFNLGWVDSQLAEEALKLSLRTSIKIQVELSNSFSTLSIEIYEAIKAGEFCYLLIHPLLYKEALLKEIKQQCEQEKEVVYAIITPQEIDKNRKPEDFNWEFRGDWYVKVLESIYKQMRNKNLTPPKQFFNEKNISVENKHKLFCDYLETEILNEIKTSKIVIIFDTYTELKQENTNLVSQENCKQIFEGLKFKEEVWKTIQDFYKNCQNNSDLQQLTFMILETPILNKARGSIVVGWRVNLGSNYKLKTKLIINGLEERFGKSNLKVLFERVLYWTELNPFLFHKICQEILNRNRNIPPGTEKYYVDQLIKGEIINLGHQVINKIIKI